MKRMENSLLTGSPMKDENNNNNNNVSILYFLSSVLTRILDRRVKTMCVFHFDALWFSFVRTIGPARTTDSQLSTASVRKSSFSVIHRVIDSFLWLCCHEAQSVDKNKINRKIKWKKMRHHNNCIPNWTESSRKFKCLDFMNDDDDRCMKCLL